MISVQVFQVFHHYLPQNQNWIHRLISNSGIKMIVGAHQYTRDAELHFPLLKTPFIGKRLHPLRFFTNLIWDRAIYKHKPTIIHAHFGTMGWAILPLAKKHNLPLVISFYGFDYLRLPHNEPIWRERYQKIFSYSAAILVEGPHGAKLIQNLGCPKSKIKIMPLPSPPIQVQNINPDKKLHILQVANYREKKGHHIHIQALKILKFKNIPFHATFIGNDLDALVQMIQGQDLTAEISLVKGQTLPEIQKAFSHFNVFVQPSHWAEDKDCEGGAPVVLLDSQAAGLPVISTFHADIPQIVQDGKTGLLVQEKDVQSLADALIQYYEMTAFEREKMGQTGQLFMQTHFNAQTLGNQLTNIYNELATSWPITQ